MKQFKVPITRREGPREMLPSDTDVIVCPSELRGDPVRIERVKLKMHNSVDEYAVYKRNSWSGKDFIWHQTPLIKLGRVTPETPILVKLDPRRPQRCHFQGGFYHTLLTWRFSTGEYDDSFLNYVCGDFHYKRGAEIADNTVPTCPDCLAEEWLPFVVAEYDRPEDVRKIQEKEAAERRFRANIPTRFDRIDDILDPKPEPEPEPEVPVDIDLTPDHDEPQGREAKLTARVRHQKHIEAAINQKRCK